MYKFALQKVTYVDEYLVFMLTSSESDTLRPLGILFRVFTNCVHGSDMNSYLFIYGCDIISKLRLRRNGFNEK